MLRSRELAPRCSAVTGTKSFGSRGFLNKINHPTELSTNTKTIFPQSSPKKRFLSLAVFWSALSWQTCAWRLRSYKLTKHWWRNFHIASRRWELVFYQVLTAGFYLVPGGNSLARLGTFCSNRWQLITAVDRLDEIEMRKYLAGEHGTAEV